MKYLFCVRYRRDLEWVRVICATNGCGFEQNFIDIDKANDQMISRLYEGVAARRESRIVRMRSMRR